MNGPQKLRLWMQMNKLTHAQFGKTVGTTGTSVFRWVSGLHRPRWSQIRKIREATEGFVTGDDWETKDAASNSTANHPSFEIANC